MSIILSTLYIIAFSVMSAFGFVVWILLILGLWHWRKPSAPSEPLDYFPTVLVQLPIYNEQYVVERLIKAACALDYPRDRLVIQVLDDSSDDCRRLAKASVEHHRALGIPIVYEHRSQRVGYKAGALAHGMNKAAGDFIAIFDADFVPPPDFLQRVMPMFKDDAGLGMVQTRWEHLNPNENALTRAQALYLDSYFSLAQRARAGGKLLLNFNGSAGVWRRTCIETAGGWSASTLAEDLDLSFRAQLSGWRMAYRPDISAPAEIPTTIIAFKRQQYRWATGAFQSLRKLGDELLRAKMPFYRKALGMLHLAGYMTHPMAMTILLLSLPLILSGTPLPVPVQWGSIAGLASPLAIVIVQLRLRRADEWKRLAYFPITTLMGIGLGLTNTYAMLVALFGREQEFKRTPKGASPSAYVLPVDWATWGELLLAVYALGTSLLAFERGHELAVPLLAYVAGYGFTSLRALWESREGWRLKWWAKSESL